jgi:hypothetical protein
MSKNAKKHNGDNGRPSPYRPYYAEQARKLCVLGATDDDLANFFGVATRTIYRWTAKHEEFCQALKCGKDPADDRVERSLYHRAVGYTFEAVKLVTAGGVTRQVRYREHVPPDTTAAIFWLKNRRKEQWRDKQEHTVTGADGGPVRSVSLSKGEFEAIARRIAKEF